METIYATFQNNELATKAAGALVDHGVRSEDISIIFPNGYNPDTNDDYDPNDQIASGITTTTPADVTAGAAKGAGMGLGVGALAALASVMIPGVGLVLGGGALAIALAGMAGTTAAGAVAGGVTGYLKDQGIPEENLRTFDDVLHRGGSLICVSAMNDVPMTEIESVLKKYEGQVTSKASEVRLL